MYIFIDAGEYSYWLPMTLGLLVCGLKDRNISQIHFQVREFRGKYRFSQKLQEVAGCVFFRKRTGVYAAASPDRLEIPTGRVADFIADSIWSDYDIWGDCQENNERKKTPPVCRRRQ